MTTEEKVLSEMRDYLNAEQLEKLKNVLILALYGKDEKGEEKNELMCLDENMRILNIYFASLKIGGRSEKTMQKYALDIRNMLQFFDGRDLKEITTNEIRYYLAWYKENRKVTNTTLENMRLTFVALFGWLENEDYIAKSPMRKIPPIKKDTQPEKAFTQDEIEKLKFGAESIVAGIELYKRTKIKADVITFGSPMPLFFFYSKFLARLFLGNVTQYAHWSDFVTYCPPLLGYHNVKVKRLGKFNIKDLFNPGTFHMIYDEPELYE